MRSVVIARRASAIVAIAAAAYALTRTGARRLVATVVAVLTLATPLVLQTAAGRPVTIEP